jgi:hypothetical protein
MVFFIQKFLLNRLFYYFSDKVMHAMLVLACKLTTKNKNIEPIELIQTYPVSQMIFVILIHKVAKSFVIWPKTGYFIHIYQKRYLFDCFCCFCFGLFHQYLPTYVALQPISG